MYFFFYKKNTRVRRCCITVRRASIIGSCFQDKTFHSYTANRNLLTAHHCDREKNPSSPFFFFSLTNIHIYRTKISFTTPSSRYTTARVSFSTHCCTKTIDSFLSLEKSKSRNAPSALLPLKKPSSSLSPLPRTTFPNKYEEVRPVDAGPVVRRVKKKKMAGEGRGGV